MASRAVPLNPAARGTGGSRDRTRLLAAGVRALLLLGFVLGPWIFPSFRAMDVLAKIMIFAVVVASYDLIIGYTGIVSFAHGMFFGLGAYCLALVIHHGGEPRGYHLAVALVLAVGLSSVLASAVAFFSLRVKAIFFAMVTLALAEFAHILGGQWTSLTLGEDGVSFRLPGVLGVGWTGGEVLGVSVGGRLITYYAILGVSVAVFAGLLRFVESPVGRVIESIRENEQRATALGYRTFHYQLLATVVGSAGASIAGVLFAAWVRYVNPESVLGIPIMLNILFMVIIGGLGTLYGGIVGAAFIMVAETWLPELQTAASTLLPGVEIAQRLAERWVLYFGILFMLVVFLFPKGIMGAVHQVLARREPTRTGGQ
ncbi:branched-chain amino acid ABC transporter permease [Deferrisoma palaeochoriense]